MKKLLFLSLSAFMQALSMDGNVNQKLLEASCKGDSKSIKEALNNGADVNVQCDYFGETPLIYAASQGRRTIVRLLIESGADVNIAADFSSMSALIWAASKGYCKIVKLLLLCIK